MQKLPHKGWAYIGWSDEYYLVKSRPKAYAPAEAILRQALAQPNLEDREWVLDRLKCLYEEWGKPEAAAAVAIELAAWREGGPETAVANPSKPGWIRKNKAKSKHKKRGRRR